MSISFFSYLFSLSYQNVTGRKCKKIFSICSLFSDFPFKNFKKRPNTRKTSTKPKSHGGPEIQSNSQGYFISSIVQIPTRFHAGSEKMSPTPWPMALIRVAAMPYLSTKMDFTASARRWESFKLYSSVPSGEA